MLHNVLVYLVGFPGSGKLTVARALAGPLNAKVVDNHWINNPIFGLVDNDRVSSFPVAIWDQIDKVRDAVLTTIATISRPETSFILTHAGYADQPDDRKIYDAIAAAADRRNAIFIPVVLTCDEAELVKRIASPERAARLKSMNVASAQHDARSRTPLRPDHPNTMALNNSHLSPQDAAAAILEHINICSTRHAPEVGQR